MAVNGVEIAVGQRWKTRGGRVVVVEKNDGHRIYPWDCDNGESYTTEGRSRSGVVSDEDLIGLVHAAPKPTSPTAPTLLDTAAGHMRDRAATYDQPEGERSMGKTVAAFNTITGRDLSESEGWMLMSLLKLVRDRARTQPHKDSLEDNIAYSALMAEARLKEAA